MLGDSNPVLSAACAKHLRVVRPKDGEEVELFDGKGSTRLYRYGKAVPGSGLEAVREAEFHSPPASRLTLFACVTKGARWDWTIEKATELGVSRIVPVLSARTIVRISGDEREAKRQRWLRIADEAARQSDAKYIPYLPILILFTRRGMMLLTESKKSTIRCWQTLHTQYQRTLKFLLSLTVWLKEALLSLILKEKSWDMR